MSFLSNLAFILVFVVAFLMISGAWAYLLASLGVRVYVPHLKMVSFTPFAVMFCLIGVVGVFCIYRSAKTFRKNKTKGWFMLFGGFIMVMVFQMFLRLFL